MYPRGSNSLTVFKCLHGLAPLYLAELYNPLAELEAVVTSLTARCQLNIPRCPGLAIYGKRTFYVGPTAWNALCDDLKDKSYSGQL
jgi:hypothetical protein